MSIFSIFSKFKSSLLLLFYFGKSSFFNIFISYHPDSYNYFSKHSEFNELKKNFIKNNKLNNSGDIVRLWSLILNVKQLLNDRIEGQFAELGVYRGNTASVLAYYAKLNNRKVYLFDTFKGFDEKDITGIDSEKKNIFNDTSIDIVKKIIGKNIDSCQFIEGYFPDSTEDFNNSIKYSFVSLDCDLYEPMKAGLNYFFPLLSTGGILFIHDYSSYFWEGAKIAVDEFCRENNLYPILLPDKSGSAVIRKF